MYHKPLLLVASCALVDPDSRILVTKRPKDKTMAGIWEFPGGKIETGESPEQALIRELDEELGIRVFTDYLMPSNFASHDYEEFHLLMPFYICRKWQGAVRAKESQGMKWVKPFELRNLQMLPADKPLIYHLTDIL